MAHRQKLPRYDTRSTRSDASSPTQEIEDNDEQPFDSPILTTLRTHQESIMTVLKKYSKGITNEAMMAISGTLQALTSDIATSELNHCVKYSTLFGKYQEVKAAHSALLDTHKTYSSALLQQQQQQRQQKQRQPSRSRERRRDDENLLIMSMSSKTSMDTAKKLLKQKGKEITERPTDVITSRDNKIIVKMRNRDQLEDLKEKMTTATTGTDITIRLSKLKKNRFIAFGIPSDLKSEEVSKEIQCHLNREIDLIRGFKGRDGTMNYIFDADNESADQLNDSPRILVDYNRIRVAPYLKIQRCFKCQELGHFSFNCTKPAICNNCLQDHPSENCTNTPKCANCIENREHRSDSTTCTAFKNYKKSLLDRQVPARQA